MCVKVPQLYLLLHFSLLCFIVTPFLCLYSTSSEHSDPIIFSANMLRHLFRLWALLRSCLILTPSSLSNDLALFCFLLFTINVLSLKKEKIKKKERLCIYFLFEHSPFALWQFLIYLLCISLIAINISSHHLCFLGLFTLVMKMAENKFYISDHSSSFFLHSGSLLFWSTLSRHSTKAKTPHSTERGSTTSCIS